MIFRLYDSEKDQKAVHRIWHETGWISSADDEKQLDVFLDANRGLVAEVNGEAECLVHSTPGVFRYQTEDLALSAITAVTTSRIARKQGFARRLTAQRIAEDATKGALVSMLGIFEQGYYDQLGYGTGSYEHWISFDPAQLKLDVRARVPKRLRKEDAASIHQALINRHRGHGACYLLPQKIVEAELGWGSKGFGLGYCDGPNGELTHFLWASANGENGPYGINIYAYENGEQFLELLALLKNLGDQVRMVRMREPQGIQMQDFLIQPFRYRQLTDKSKFVNVNRATAYWQIRMCDLPGCLAHTHLNGEPVRFNLRLTDPIVDSLDADIPWRGVGGDYVVTLGPRSEARLGTDANLPTLTATVNAFSRMWIGVQPASGLAVSDKLSGPSELLASLDQILCLPQPKWGWDF
ncbi:MAG: GNAT family N-acetyltransferase [Chloroflexi bacterium]|nr:MAG: GNAT family N-acetyltransferase [Chloroflexota bacterium]